MKLLSVGMFLLLLLIQSVPGSASEPKVPAGLDPGGFAIALLGDGIDYTKPVIAQRLARDGEGDLIAWDFVDNDIRPYAEASRSTADAEHIIAASTKVALIIIREPADQRAAIGHMATFVIRTPARVIAWPDGRSERQDWDVLFQAAERFKDRLFVVPGPARQSDAERAADNIVFAKPGKGGNDRTGVLDAAVAAAEQLSRRPKLTFADLKRILAGKSTPN